MKVIRRESGGRPWAHNVPTDCQGLLQLMKRYHPGVNLFDPLTNLSIGYRAWLRSGWDPWALTA